MANTRGRFLWSAILGTRLADIPHNSKLSAPLESDQVKLVMLVLFELSNQNRTLSPLQQCLQPVNP